MQIKKRLVEIHQPYFYLIFYWIIVKNKNMKIIDLTEGYKKHILKEKTLSAYEAVFPALFKHYFKYWADRKLFRPTLNNMQVDKRKKLIISSLKFVEQKFKKAGFDVAKLKIILFVGQNTTNGHVFLDKGEFVVWLPVEAYKTNSGGCFYCPRNSPCASLFPKS